MAGTETRGDLFHLSDGGRLLRFLQCAPACAFVLCGASQEGSPSVTASQMLTLLPANNLNKRRMRVSKITAAAPGSICFKCRGEVGEGMSSATKEISADGANAWHGSHWASDNLSCSQAKVCSFEKPCTPSRYPTGAECSVLFYEKQADTTRKLALDHTLKQGFISRMTSFLGR